jgi:hypothetical protein
LQSPPARRRPTFDRRFGLPEPCFGGAGMAQLL